MNTLRKHLFAVVALAAAFVSIARAAAVVGESAPDFTLTDITGATHKLSEFKGKTVVLEWVNPGCPFVIKHYGSGNMPNLQRKAEADGVVWLSINSGSAGAQGDLDPTEATAWLKKNGAAPTAYFRDQDGKIGRLYGAKTTPHLFVIKADGVLAYEGAIDSIRSAKVEDIAKAENYVTSALTAIKAGVPVAKTNTQPYGCSVKY